eukprot:1387562-Pleurochrysis_carterae.AAC.1
MHDTARFRNSSICHSSAEVDLSFALGDCLTECAVPQETRGSSRSRVGVEGACASSRPGVNSSG